MTILLVVPSCRSRKRPYMDLYITGHIHSTACIKLSTAPAATWRGHHISQQHAQDTEPLPSCVCSSQTSQQACSSQRARSCVYGTYVPHCIGEHHNEEAPDGGVHKQAQNEELVDAGPAGHQPTPGTASVTQRRTHSLCHPSAHLTMSSFSSN